MLYSNYKRKTNLKQIALLFIISCITFQTNGFANSKNKTAVQFRDKGFIEQQKGNLNEALTQYSKAVSLGLSTPDIFNDMAVVYEQIGLNQRAESLYLQAVEVDPNFLPATMNLAFFYKKMDDPQKAAGYFRRRFELGDPNDSWTVKAKQELLKIDPDYQNYINAIEARRLQQEILDQKEREFYNRVKLSREIYHEGLSLYKKKEYQKSIMIFDEALKLAPGDRKIIASKKKAKLELAKENIRKSSNEAIEMLEAGNIISAKREINNMLTTIPNEPIIISE